MKKHFLLLMLMALLPMAGWAVITVTAPTKATGLEYNGAEQVLITADGTITGASSDAVMLYRISADKPAFNVSAHSQWLTKANLKGLNAGTYKVWYVAYDEGDGTASSIEDDQYVSVTIARKSLTAAGSGIVFTTPANSTYTGAEQTFTPNVTDGGVAVAATNFTVSYKYCATATGDFAACTATELVKNVRYYKQVITGKEEGNYSGSLESGVFQITKADLLVQVENMDVVYTGILLDGATIDTPAGDFTLIFDGFVGGEDEGDLDTKPTVQNTKTDVGEWDVVAKNGASDNYNFVYVKGKLKIRPAIINVIVKNQTATIGSDQAAMTSWTGKEYFSDEAGHLVSNWIKLQVQNGEDASGNPTYPTTGGLEPAPIYVEGDAAILGYLTSTAYTVTDETTTPPTVYNYEYATGLTITRTSGTTAADYPLTASGASAGSNYTLNYVAGTFTIGKAPVTIELDNQAKVYGEDDPEWTWTITGADDADKAAIEEKFTITRTPGEGVGSYDVTLTVADYDKFAKYSLAETSTAKLIITKRPITIAANDQVLYVGDSFADLDQKAVTIPELPLDDEINVNLSFYATAPVAPATTPIPVALDTDKKLTLTGVTTESFYIYTPGIVAAAAEGQDDVLKNYNITWTNGILAVYQAAEVLFLDDTDENLATAIQTAASGSTIAARTRSIRFSSRELKAGQWNTLVLPFNTTVAEVSAALDYAVVDMLAPSTDPEVISLKLAFGEIPANTPFMVQPMADINLNKNSVSLVFGDKEIVYSATPEFNDGAGHKFIGTYVGHNVTSADKSEYYYSTSKKSFVNSSKSTKIGIMRAYLKDTNAAGAGARIITIEEADGSVTAIDAVETENGNGNGAIYNLQGVRVNKAGKGVFIQNGKKYIK